MTTRNLKLALMRAIVQRPETAHQAAKVIADNHEQLLAAAGGISPKLKTAVVALVEFAGFVKEIDADFDAMAGHLAEDVELVRQHEADLANVSTLVKNLPEIMDAEVRMAPYAIDPADLGTIQQAVNLISYEIEMAAQTTHRGKVFRVGVVIKESQDGK